MSNEWISVKEAMPELVNDEPFECELQTDLDGEDKFVEGFFDRKTWWIKLASPFVGHRDIRTYDIDVNVTHWRPKNPLLVD